MHSVVNTYTYQPEIDKINKNVLYCQFQTSIVEQIMSWEVLKQQYEINVLPTKEELDKLFYYEKQPYNELLLNNMRKLLMKTNFNINLEKYSTPTAFAIITVLFLAKRCCVGGLFIIGMLWHISF